MKMNNIRVNDPIIRRKFEAKNTLDYTDAPKGVLTDIVNSVSPWRQNIGEGNDVSFEVRLKSITFRVSDNTVTEVPVTVLGRKLFAMFKPGQPTATVSLSGHALSLWGSYGLKEEIVGQMPKLKALPGVHEIAPLDGSDDYIIASAESENVTIVLNYEIKF